MLEFYILFSINLYVNNTPVGTPDGGGGREQGKMESWENERDKQYAKRIILYNQMEISSHTGLS